MVVSSQNLTIALQIFVNHYFSFPWLRKYLSERRFRLTVGSLHPSSVVQASNDLMFLTRLSYEGFPLVSILPVMCTIIQSLETYGQLPISSELTNKFYFIVEIKNKVLCSPPPISILWKKVLTVPFGRQKHHCYYLQAKTKEMLIATPGYGFEANLLSAFSHSSRSPAVVDSFVSTDWTVRRSIEAQKPLENQIKYYHSLSTEAHKNGNNTLCSYWDDVIRKELNGEKSTMDFSIAWSIQKGVDASTRKDSIWRIVAGLLENPENIPAIQQIISVVSTIEHLFLPFDKILAVVGKQSSLLRVN
jgi:hypothetical protein